MLTERRKDGILVVALRFSVLFFEVIMLKHFVKSFLGGFVIAIGAVACLSVENKALGAFLFTLGVFSVSSFGFCLFTGKVCFIPNKQSSFIKDIILTYLGNFIGTVSLGLVLPFTKLSILVPKAQEIAALKLSDTLFSAFVMSVLCGMMICISVLGFKTIKDGTGKYIALFLPIMVYILAGFENSIANLFYYTFAGAWGSPALIHSAVVALGNLIGGTLIPFAAKYTDNIKLGCEE
jgi:formate/nitrite transporter FocA (FNT family)